MLNAHSDTPMVSRSTAIGAGLGGAFGGLILGSLLAFAFFVFRNHRSGGQGLNPFSAKFTSVPRFSMSEDTQTHYDEHGRHVSDGMVSVSHSARSPTTFSRHASDTPLITPFTVEPFVLPGPSDSTTGPDTASATHTNSAATTPFSSTNTRSGSGGQRPLSADHTSSPSASSPSDERRDGGGSGDGSSGLPQPVRGSSHVYVVHHDGGRAPVTVYTDDGAEVVELPPRYTDDRREGREANPVERPRQPGSVPRKPRGARTSSGTGSRS